jgi:ABC-type microcin C transport system permease subunit YejB
MGRYILRRLLQFIPTVLGTMFLLHYIVSLGILRRPDANA